MAPQKHLDQMKLRLEALLPEVGLSEDRLVQEAAHIADKLDVAEEVNRLRIRGPRGTIIDDITGRS